MADIETKKVNIELEVDTNVVDSNKNKYQSWIDMAKAVDAWRIFPRLFLTVYIILLYKCVVGITEYHMENNSFSGSGLLRIWKRVPVPLHTTRAFSGFRGRYRKIYSS